MTYAQTIALTHSRSRPILGALRSDPFCKFVRRNQVLGDLLVLRDERRLCIEHLENRSAVGGPI
jgi:hypothetical protein